MLGPYLPGTIGGMERLLVRPSPLDQIKGLWSLRPSTTSSWYLIDGDCFCCVLLVGISFSSQRAVSMVCLGGPSPRVWWKFFVMCIALLIVCIVDVCYSCVPTNLHHQTTRRSETVSRLWRRYTLHYTLCFPLVSVIVYRKFCYHRACCDLLVSGTVCQILSLPHLL